MITLLIYGCKQEELNTIKKLSRQAVAKLTDEKLVIREDISEDGKNPQLAIVNICGDGGLERAQQVRRHYRDVSMMLVSNTSISPMQYLNPYIHPISLVIQPYEEKELADVLQDFFQKIVDENEDGIWVESYDGKVKVLFNSILYVEASNKMLNVRLETVEYSVYGSLEQYEKRLPATFMRCHRGVIVNTRFIDKVRFSENYIRLKNGEHIPLSRSCKQNFKEMMKG